MANEIGLIKEPKYHQFTADHYYMIDKDNKKSIISAKNLSSAAKSTSNETMKEIINKMLEFLNLKKTGYE